MSLDSAVTTLVSRLEAVTARLESVEKQLAAGGGGGGAAPAASSGPASGWLKEFDDLVADNIPAFVELSNKVGTDTLKKQAGLFQQAIAAHRAFLEMASKSKKPADLSSYLAPTSALVGSVIELRDKSRADKMFNWLSAVSEAIPLLGWVTVEKTPAPFINEFKGNSEFYSNKILMEFKKKGDAGKDNVEWVGKLSGFIKGLHAHVKSVHTTGLKWNAAGGDAYVPSGGAAPAAAAPAAGPPPPGPAPVIPKTEPTKSAGGGAGALFAQINKGGVTSGLKKVTNDMKVYKNPSLRAGAVVKADAIPAKKAAPKFGRQTKKGTPKFALEGNKWVIEFQEDNKEIVIENPETKHVVYVYGCTGSVINIKGKVNAVTVDNCKKCGFCFTDAIASFEVVNCQSIQTQCLGSVPSFAVDKTSGCQIILGKDGLGTELVQSKSSEMNIMIPEGDDMVELPVPEQFKTVIKDGKLVTECVQHV